MKGAIVGYGFIAEHGHHPAYQAAKESGLPLDIVAVADTCPARLEVVRAKHPGVKVYDSAKALLDGERDLQFVDVTVPPSAHAEISCAALERGLHVLCEKPMATTRMEALRMIDTAKKSGRVLFASHNYRHAPVMKSVRKAIDSGAIGQVKMVTLHTFRSTHARGVDEWNPDWRRERRYSGGGIGMDHGSHTFYLAFDWLGSYPTAISATASTLGPYDTEDNLACSIRFPNGMASAHLTWTAGVRKVLYTIHGDKGAIRVEDDEVEIARMLKPSGSAANTAKIAPKTAWEIHRETIESDWMDASHVKWFRSLYSEFIEAVAKGDLVGRNAKDGLACVSLIEAAYVSAREGGREQPLYVG